MGEFFSKEGRLFKSLWGLKMEGRFVDVGGYTIWVWATDVDCLVQGKESSYEQQARLKAMSGFVNFLGTDFLGGNHVRH